VAYISKGYGLSQMEEIVLNPIGVIRSPFHDVEGMPVQPIGAQGVTGTIELRDDLEPGLKDLDGFSHIMLIYWFHLSKGYSLHVLPFLDRTPRGVFSTRVPRRPNGIGLSVVKLLGIRGSVLDIEEVDVLDGTPLLDIKPYVPKFDNVTVQRTGWFTDQADQALVVRADRRFVDASGQVDSQRTEPGRAMRSGPSR
jgi:tRNA (adenine37-N6)-methyltransferase